MGQKGLLVFFWILSAGYSFAQKQSSSDYNPDKKYTPAQLHADLGLLRRAIEEAHPGLYRYNTPDQIRQRFDSLMTKASTDQTELQFYGEISAFMATIGCGHTATYMSKTYKKGYAEKRCHYFPFAVKITGSRLFILSNFSTDTTLVRGSEITTINGRSIPEILGLIFPHICSDGYNTTLKHHDAEEEFMFYYSELIAQPPFFSLTVKTPGDELIRSRSVPALTLDDMQKINEKRNGRKNLHREKQKPLEFHLTGDKTAILRVSSLDAADISAAGQHFHAFIRNVFDTLKSKGVNDLVLDLRDNGGGDDDFGWYLYSFISDSAFRFYDHVEVASDKKLSFLRYTNQSRLFNLMHLFVKRDSSGHVFWTHGTGMKMHLPQRNPYRGHVFVLINGESFSATAEFCSIADYHKRAVFIGEETGGAYEGNNSGVEMVLTLPNTHVRVNIPIMKYVCAVSKDHQAGRGIMPAYPVQPTIEDILSGKDTELEFTLELIRKKNCKACGRE